MAVRSGDAAVVEHVRRLAALAGVEVLVVPSGAVPPPHALLVDDVGGGRGPRDTVGPAVEVAADGAHTGPGVLRLPSEAEALLGVLTEAGAPERARVLGVVGAVGGAGASVLAAALARLAVGAGVPTALADLDPGGGGVDVLLGIEHDPGPRWADVLTERGGFPPDRLTLALPAWHSVRVLSTDVRAGVAPDDAVVDAGLRALGRAVDLLVLDLPRQVLAPASAPPWLGLCSDVVLVAGTDLRSAAAAAAAVRTLGPSGAALHLVARSGGGLTADDVADAAGVAHVVAMRPERALAAGIERGAAPGDQRRGPLAAAARRLLREIGVPG
ncbi:septum site-determining protein Ssd [Georgenia faecalis]|uniref:septum site-determining protein Ssd n=1 Tax=Georgenia faecalis TaxID=2483799 RepID=UPI000FD711E1|nr:septum site-determining protein Ssd [Georgenia faecalis]